MRKYGDSVVKKVRFLRNHGFSLPEISREMKIPKTTVFDLVKGVEILPEYLSEWTAKRGGSRRTMLKKIKQAAVEGEKFVSHLTKKEKILILCALYWAEGNKKDFILTNTDPALIRVFIRVLKDTLRLKNDQIRISLRLYEDLDKEKCLNFWSKIVGIPKSKFLTTNILPGKKIGKLEYGMCRVRVVKGGDLLKKVMGINKIIAKRFGQI